MCASKPLKIEVWLEARARYSLLTWPLVPQVIAQTIGRRMSTTGEGFIWVLSAKIHGLRTHRSYSIKQIALSLHGCLTIGKVAYIFFARVQIVISRRQRLNCVASTMVIAQFDRMRLGHGSPERIGPPFFRGFDSTQNLISGPGSNIGDIFRATPPGETQGQFTRDSSMAR